MTAVSPAPAPGGGEISRTCSRRQGQPASRRLRPALRAAVDRAAGRFALTSREPARCQTGSPWLQTRADTQRFARPAANARGRTRWSAAPPILAGPGERLVAIGLVRSDADRTTNAIVRTDQDALRVQRQHRRGRGALGVQRRQGERAAAARTTKQAVPAPFGDALVAECRAASAAPARRPRRPRRELDPW
jgi:hypothetical protein